LHTEALDTAAKLEVVNGTGYQVSLSMEMEHQEAWAMEEPSQELMATESKFQKALEAHRGLEFQVILHVETEFLKVPVVEAAHRMEL
jgi:hypothetical protein